MLLGPVQRHEGEGASVGMVRRILVAIAMLLPGVPALAEEIQGRVTAVAGGDAITVADAGRGRHEVRLAHIRAPFPWQPFADRSPQNLGACCSTRRCVSPAPGANAVARSSARHG